MVKLNKDSLGVYLTFTSSDFMLRITFLMHVFFSSDRVAVGRALDLPVYFGDAGSREVG